MPFENGCNCELHPFVCGNSLVPNHDHCGIGKLVCVRMMMQHEHVIYTINSDGDDGCCIYFVAWDYVVGENG